MKSDDLIKAMNGLDEDLLQRADAYRGRVYRKGMRIPVVLASVAAVILLILIGARIVSRRENKAPGNTGEVVQTETGNTETAVSEASMSKNTDDRSLKKPDRIHVYWQDREYVYNKEDTLYDLVYPVIEKCWNAGDTAFGHPLVQLAMVDEIDEEGMKDLSRIVFEYDNPARWSYGSWQNSPQNTYVFFKNRRGMAVVCQDQNWRQHAFFPVIEEDAGYDTLWTIWEQMAEAEDPEMISESEIASGEMTETVSEDTSLTERTVPDIESLTKGVYSFAQVKDITDKLTGFSYEELEKAWGVPGEPLIVDTKGWYLHVCFWRSGEYSLDVALTREGYVEKALTYRTEDEPTIW